MQVVQEEPEAKQGKREKKQQAPEPVRAVHPMKCRDAGCYLIPMLAGKYNGYAR